MAQISQKATVMPASAIRKLVPLADAAKKEGTKVYHLNIGQPDIDSPDCALNAVKNNTLTHISYCNSAGLPELRNGLAEKYYKKIGIDIDPSELIVTVAGSESVLLALEVTCDEGDEVIVLEPFYTNYNTFAYMNGITLKAIPTDIRNGFAVPSIDEFEKAITDKTKAILICNPGNPSGTLYSKENMLALGEIAKKHDLFFISDEVYREFVYSDEPHFSAMHIPGLEQNVILVDSVSKRYNLCGARVGCIVSHNKEVMAAAMKYAQARLCPPILGQIAAIGALDTPDAIGWLSNIPRITTETSMRLSNPATSIPTSTVPERFPIRRWLLPKRITGWLPWKRLSSSSVRRCRCDSMSSAGNARFVGRTLVDVHRSFAMLRMTQRLGIMFLSRIGTRIPCGAA